MRRLNVSARRRVALLALPVVLATVPVVLANASGPISCDSVQDGGLHWQRTALPISNPTGFAVDYTQPNRLLVSSASQIFVSDNHGCSWVTAVSLDTLAQDAGYSSAISRIVDVGFSLRGRAIATISEGVGSEARPHVIQSDNGARGTWSTSDTGLPPVGEPRTLGAGILGFVIGMAQFGSDLPGGGLPGVGGDPTGQVPAMVYRSIDGTNWKAGATSDEFGGSHAISLIAADRFLSSEVYAVVGGDVYYSHDAGGHFARSSAVPGTPTAIATTFQNEVSVYGTGFASRSINGGRTFSRIRTVPGARAAAWRTDGNYMVASSSKVALTNGSSLQDVTPAKYPGGSPNLRSTFIGEDTWYLTVGSRLYRWFDRYKPAKQPPGIPNQRVSYPPKPGSITPSGLVLNLRPNGSRTITYRLHLPKSPTPLDVFYLIDVSASLGPLIDDLKQNAKDIGVSLKRQGIDINEGIAAVGTAPNTARGAPPDPPTNPLPPCKPGDPSPRACDTRGPYHQPVLYKRWAPVGKVDQDFFAAVDRLQEEYYLPPTGGCNPDNFPDRNKCDMHLEGQLIGYEQAINGDGITGPSLNVPVPPGQAADFRQNEDTRRIIIMGTDARFTEPPGSPMRNGHLDFAGIGSLLKKHGVLALGLTVGSTGPESSRGDLEYMARATGALAPPGGIACQYGDYGTRIPAGQPIVCDDQAHFSAAIGRLLASLADYQKVSLSVGRTSPALRGLSTSLFPKVNVKSVFDTDFQVTYSCVGLAPGSYPSIVKAGLRGYTVATTTTTVNCGESLIPPAVKTDPVPVAQNPPGQPAPPPPAPLPAQPVTQAQAQAQVQINPQVGGAAQEQEQLQLALAQAGIFMVDDEDEKVTQQAMSARHGDERVAVALLAAAMAATSIAGLAMMRRHRAQLAARPEPAWVRRS